RHRLGGAAGGVGVRPPRQAGGGDQRQGRTPFGGVPSSLETRRRPAGAGGGHPSDRTGQRASVVQPRGAAGTARGPRSRAALPVRSGKGPLHPRCGGGPSAPRMESSGNPRERARLRLRPRGVRPVKTLVYTTAFGTDHYFRL